MPEFHTEQEEFIWEQVASAIAREAYRGGLRDPVTIADAAGNVADAVVARYRLALKEQPERVIFTAEELAMNGIQPPPELSADPSDHF